MSDWVTIKIRKTVHQKAVDITQNSGKYLGVYLTAAIEEKNEAEQQRLDWIQEEKSKQAFRQRMTR